MTYDYLVVGAGLAGAVLAERLAGELGASVLVVEKRDHIAGNVHDFPNEEGILVQAYGPHIFHTTDETVWNYLGQFTQWNDYVHRVLAMVNGRAVSLPINIETMEQLFDRPFTAEEMAAYFEEHRLKLERIENARDVVVSQVGEELYNLFFKNYTKKQWGLYPEELAAEVTKRLPVRFDRDTRYFADPYQGIPVGGFTAMVQRMLDNPRIEIRLGMDYHQLADSASFGRLVYTGRIDEFFDYAHGKLPYRAITFEHEMLDIERFQNAGVVNYPNEHDYTRITEFKQLYQQEHPKTAICYEYPAVEGLPCYPIPTAANRRLYGRYQAEARKLDGVHFLGRLAQYEYLNMDQVVGRALEFFERIRAGV